MFPVAYHTTYHHPVAKGHRFPMEKYSLLIAQLLHQGIIHQNDVFVPDLVDLDFVLAIHEAAYITRFTSGKLSTQEARRIGFEQSPLLVERELRLVEGTRLGALKALKSGIAFNIAGGTHHACYSHGEGFCMINDQAVAAQYLLNHQYTKQILIVDLDVHQGNGTAQIFRTNSQVFTFSMHGASNYPFRKEKSDLDIGLEDGTGDELYLELLANTLPQLIAHVNPDFIFYQAGVDILHTDKMGRMACTLQGCAQRDEIVLKTAYKHGIPLQCSMGGGYSADIKTILEAHTQTFKIAASIY